MTREELRQAGEVTVLSITTTAHERPWKYRIVREPSGLFRIEEGACYHLERCYGMDTEGLPDWVVCLKQDATSIEARFFLEDAIAQLLKVIELDLSRHTARD